MHCWIDEQLLWRDRYIEKDRVDRMRYIHFHRCLGDLWCSSILAMTVSSGLDTWWSSGCERVLKFSASMVSFAFFHARSRMFSFSIINLANRSIVLNKKQLRSMLRAFHAWLLKLIVTPDGLLTLGRRANWSTSRQLTKWRFLYRSRRGLFQICRWHLFRRQICHSCGHRFLFHHLVCSTF